VFGVLSRLEEARAGMRGDSFSHACHLRHSLSIVHLPAALLEVDLVKRGPRILHSFPSYAENIFLWLGIAMGLPARAWVVSDFCFSLTCGVPRTRTQESAADK
jgi:hypothetical protein